MRALPFLALPLLLGGGCSSNLYVLSQAPAQIELAASDRFGEQEVLDAAQAHCRGQRHDAVEVRRRPLGVMPDGIGPGRAVLFYCR